MSLPRLRAPQEHGQILAVPPLDQMGALLAGNRRIFATTSISCLGQSLFDLRSLARREVLSASTQYHHEASEPVPDDASDTWLVAGHQPEMFHPGVWFKNFALHQLARRHGAVSVNLIIDTDTAKPAVLHVPGDGRLARVAFDRTNAETPYEERIVEEETTFRDVSARVAPLTAAWNFEPMLPAYWAEVMKQAGRTPLLGERFAAARRAMERRWGVAPREVPMSRVCQTKAFAWFACAIVSEIPAFHALYNQIVHDYRLAHGIRSRSHPVPDLTVDGDWLEAPFWAWRRGQARRSKLFVRLNGNAWQLRVGEEHGPTLPVEAAAMVNAWHALESQGFKIRSRALTTTMFARLFLADLFLHGIGGGLYDELTDRLIERFFKIPAPAFVVVSATLLLPLSRYSDAPQRVRELERRSRDLVFKPERFIAANEQTESLVRAKQQWIAASRATHAERVERFHGIRDINVKLLPWVLPETQVIEAEHREQLRRMAFDEVAGRRDYAFCLYPEEMLRAFFTQVIG